MRTTFLALVLSTLAPAAPKLPPTFEFVSHKAVGKNEIIDFRGRPTGATTFRADFAVKGPAGKCVVELWMEGGNTGEKVRLIDRHEVDIPASGQASGRFDRNDFDVIPGHEREGRDRLPFAGEGQYWAYRLILKRPKGDPVADTGVHMVPCVQTIPDK
jgi:hypothetical protein